MWLVRFVGTPGTGSSGEPCTISNQYDEEVALPPSSKQLVENLIRENNKLKHQLHNPQKIDELNMVSLRISTANVTLGNIANVGIVIVLAGVSIL